MSQPRAFQDVNALIQPDQHATEFEQLLSFYEALNPRKVLEIGSRAGGSLYQFMLRTKPGATIVSVDDPYQRWGMDKEPNICQWYEWAGMFGHTLIPLRGNSHDKEIVNAVRPYAQYDFVFVDGDHRYEGVWQDFDNYAWMARGGVMAFHDILPDETDPQIGVHMFWNEIKAVTLKYQEFISDQYQNGYGIGVLYV